MVTINKVLRILSYVCIASPIPFAFAGKSGPGFLEVCECFWIGACAVLLSAPLAAEVLSEKWRGVIAPVVSCLTLILCCVLGCNPLLPVCVILSCLILILYLRTVRWSWKNEFPQTSCLSWSVLEREARLILSSVLVVVALLGALLPDKTGCHIVYAALLLCCYAFLLYRSLSGHTVIFPKKLENRCMDGELWKLPSKSSATQEMGRIYRRVLTVMELEKPFLNEAFSINDLVPKVYTNKSYISKAINLNSGMNFRTFVNGYRVRYSTSLMRSNKDLKVADISVMSGFHSDVTFNMAFKLAYGRTPGEYYQELKTQGLKHPSTKKGPEPSDEPGCPEQGE